MNTEMSAYRDRPEVVGARSNDAFGPNADVKAAIE